MAYGRMVRGIVATAIVIWGLTLPMACGIKLYGGKLPAKPRIAVLLKSMNHPLPSVIADNARMHQQARPDAYELLLDGVQNASDGSRQAELVEQMIASGINALVIAPADPKGLVPLCKKAIQAGVLVIAIETPFAPEALNAQKIKIPFVGPNYRKGARMVGDYLARQLEPGAPVALISSDPGTPNRLECQQGYREAMNSAGIPILLEQTVEGEPVKAQQAISSIVSEHPTLKALLCADDDIALTAASVLRTLGKTTDIKVVGFGGMSAALDLIKQGELSATANPHEDNRAVFGIEHAMLILQEHVAVEDRETPVDLVTPENCR